MTNEIKELIESQTAYRICERCDGEGEIDAFCGHESWEYCEKCDGAGVIKDEPLQSISELVMTPNNCK